MNENEEQKREALSSAHKKNQNRRIEYRETPCFKTSEILQSFEGEVESLVLFIQCKDFLFHTIHFSFKELHHLLSISVSLSGLFRGNWRRVESLAQLVHLKHLVTECGLNNFHPAQGSFHSLGNFVLFFQEIVIWICPPAL